MKTGTHPSIRVLIAEEQPLLRTAYRAQLRGTVGVHVVGDVARVDVPVLRAAALRARPDAMLIGTRCLDGSLVEQISSSAPLGTVVGLLFVAYTFDARVREALAAINAGSGCACACVRKQEIESAAQLAGLLRAVVSRATAEVPR
jgi:DNA-binding NarL/FixJ family response regulator